MSAPDLYLSPHQQSLLRAALDSNKPQGTSQSPILTQNDHSSPADMSEQNAPGSGHLDYSDDSPYLDFGMDGEGDDSFNFDNSGQMIGDVPEDSPESDLHEKRKSIDGQDDDDEGGGKRREGDDKTAKKPGRKPLTVEPTSKRKAQNRAAQRAFRERKEKHLKDLETKVEELEKSSESQNHENVMLRAQVERLQIQLQEYRKRVSWMSNNGGGRPQQSTNQPTRHGSAASSDFQFEFPKFGDLPLANFKATGNNNGSNQSQQNGGTTVESYSSNSPVSGAAPGQSVSNMTTVSDKASRTESVGTSPINNSNYTASPVASNFSVAMSQQHHSNSIDSLTGLFSPSILEASRKNSLGYFPDSTANQNRGDQTSLDYGQVPALTHSTTSNTDSPASSAESHQHVSSIGTSPEPMFNSPATKQHQDFNLNALNTTSHLNDTFGMPNFTTDLASTNFDWLAQQNGGSFDPVLFGDYRETQDNVLSQDFGSFFNDAYPLPDLGSPLHNYGDVVQTPAVEVAQKRDLMKQVEVAKEGEEVVPADKGKMLTCNKIWDRLQSMEKFRNGEIDIDNLCSELRAKAKCSEGGAVVAEKYVDKLLGKH